jgi:hypothetical protein
VIALEIFGIDAGKREFFPRHAPLQSLRFGDANTARAEESLFPSVLAAHPAPNRPDRGKQKTNEPVP